MTLEEAFKKYSDYTKMKRKGYMLSLNISWLKGFKAWGNEKSQELGFIIPQFMIEDANADDWEVV